MKAWLEIAVIVLGAAIGLLIAFVLLREFLRARKGRRWQEEKKRCHTLVGRLEELKVNEFLPLALELKKSFPPEMVVTVLDAYRDKVTANASRELRQKIAEMYESLGWVESHLRTLEEGESWGERANAADKLGAIGHVRAVLPLLAVLRDEDEDSEVKRIVMQTLGRIDDERAIVPMIEMLGKLESTMGQLLADVLIQFKERVTAHLVQALENSCIESQRFWIVRILKQSSTETALQAIFKCLNDHAPRVRAEAVRAIGVIRAKEGVLALCKLLLEDPSAAVREAAAEAIGNIGDSSAISALGESLAEQNFIARQKVMSALEHMGNKAIPFFCEALQSESSVAASQAAVALERMGVVSSWIESLEGERWHRPFRFLSLVARAGAVETIARLLAHSQMVVRIRLCRILSRSNHQRTEEALLALISNEKEWTVRMEAYLGLVRFSTPSTINAFKLALKENEEILLERVIRALRRASQEVKRVLEEEISLHLQDLNFKVRVESIRFLATLRSESVCQRLLESMQDIVPEVRRESASALANCPLNDESMHALMNALEDYDLEVRLAAIKSLGELKAIEAIPLLMEQFEKVEQRQCDAIAEALAHMPYQEIYKLTDRLMGLSHPRARLGVAKTLGALGETQLSGLLLTFLRDPLSEVREASARSLKNLILLNFEKDKAHESTIILSKIIGSLEGFLSDPNASVRGSIVDALALGKESSTLEMLMELLGRETDQYVCARIVLALGYLGGFERVKVQIKLFTQTQSVLQEWIQENNSNKNFIIGLVAQALFGETLVFKEVLKAAYSKESKDALHEVLQSVPEEAQRIFFNYLCISPEVFDSSQPEALSDYYLQLLQSSHNVHERVSAIEALELIEGEGVGPALEISFEKDPAPDVRKRALIALGSILPKVAFIEKIMHAASDPSLCVREQVLPLVNRLSSKDLEGAKDKFLPLLDSRDEGVRKTVAELLARLYQNDWQFLVDTLLGSSSEERVLGLIETLGNIGDPRLSLIFLKWMCNQNPIVRGEAAKAAAKSHVLSVEEWYAFLSDPMEKVRLAAVHGVGKNLSNESLTRLSQLVSDPSQCVRKELVVLLGRKKVGDMDLCVQVLRHFVKDSSVSVRFIALVSLLRLGEFGLVREILEIFDAMPEEEKKNVEEYLKVEGVLNEFSEKLECVRDFRIRTEAVELLSCFDLEQYSRQLTVSLCDPSSEVRLAAVKALGQLESLEIQQAIDLLAKDPISEVREAVKRRRLRAVN